jgi:hypothetical protein
LLESSSNRMAMSRPDDAPARRRRAITGRLRLEGPWRTRTL